MLKGKLFEGLENLGFTATQEIKLYDTDKKKAADKKESKKQIRLEDCILEKEFVCPVCDSKFKNNTVRRTKLRLMSSDVDLKANYEPVNPIHYDVILCPKCGYAALTMFFNKVSEKGGEEILKQITPLYKNKQYPVILPIEDVIERYKLALLNAVVKKAKAGEKGYICLKIAWLYREKNDEANEQAFMENALIGFEAAYSNESFPICSLDENTFIYLLAALYKQTGKPSEALKWLAKIITSRTVEKRLKDRAVDLRLEIQSDAKKS